MNGAAFYSDYKEYPVSSLVIGRPSTQNAASGRSYGAELVLTGKFGVFEFNFGGGYLDAEFARSVCTNDTNNPADKRALCLAGATANRADSLVNKGQVLPFSPKWTLSGGVQYTFRTSSYLSITPRLQWSHIGVQLATPFPIVPAEMALMPGFQCPLPADTASRRSSPI